MFCTNCGRPMEEGQEICNFCKDLPELKFNYCQYCGEKIVGDSSVCFQCEQKINKDTALNNDTNDLKLVKNLITFVKKRSMISILLWLIVTVVEVVALILFYKIYPFYLAIVFNLYFIINDIKYYSTSKNNIGKVIEKMKKKSENLELTCVLMILIGIIVGGIPAYYDLKTIKKVISDAKGII